MQDPGSRELTDKIFLTNSEFVQLVQKINHARKSPPPPPPPPPKE